MELKCFEGTGHKFEIDYEYEVLNTVISTSTDYSLQAALIHFLQEIEEERVNSETNRSAQSSFNGDAPPAPGPIDPLNKGDRDQSSSPRKSFRHDCTLYRVAAKSLTQRME